MKTLLRRNNSAQRVATRQDNAAVIDFPHCVGQRFG